MPKNKKPHRKRRHNPSMDAPAMDSGMIQPQATDFAARESWFNRFNASSGAEADRLARHGVPAPFCREDWPSIFHVAQLAMASRAEERNWAKFVGAVTARQTVGELIFTGEVFGEPRYVSALGPCEVREAVEGIPLAIKTHGELAETQSVYSRLSNGAIGQPFGLGTAEMREAETEVRILLQPNYGEIVLIQHDVSVDELDQRLKGN